MAGSSGRVMSKAEQFMGSPLVVWLNTFDDFNAVKTVHDLADGILLHKVMYTIDPSNYSMTKVNRSVSRDLSLRMQNLQLLVERIRNFYLMNMQQLIIGSLPNIVSICNSPESEYSLDQMEKLLILVLGCAVKCEPLVEKMKAMEPIQQQALVTNIKQVTHSTELVCSIDWDDLNEIPKQALQGLCRTAYGHLQRVAKERDTQFEAIIEISLEKDYYKQFHNTSSLDPEHHNGGLSISRSPSTPSRSPGINTDVLELKKKVRHLEEQLDHKSDMAIELKEELEQIRLIAQKLQQDKRELAEDAKAARAYRDEIEMLKVQSAKAERLETDVIKYRQKAEDAEYLKKKIAGLKTENDLTIQTKGLLEQKIEALTSRSDALDELQENYASVKAQLESLQQEKEMDLEKIEELLARNAHLELEFKHYEERLAQLNTELEISRANALEANSNNNESSNLSFEMSEAEMASKAKVIRLEREAQEMEKSMESLRHAQAKAVELEKMNKKLHTQTHTDRKEIIKLREEVEVLKIKASRVDKLQVELNSQRERVEEAGRSSARLKEIKTKYDIVLEAKAKLEDEVESLQSKIRLADHLKDDNASLKAQADSLTTEHEEDQKRIQELLQQNAQLELEKQRCSEETETLKSQLLQVRSKSGPHAPVTMVSPPRYSEAEMASRAKLQRLEKETKEMEKTMEALRHTQAKCSELEKGNKKLMEQTHADRKEVVRLNQELQSSKAKLERMEKLHKEMKDQEQQVEDVDAAKRKITELKQQNSLLSEAKILLQEEMNGLHSKLEKYNSSQADSISLRVRVEAMEVELQEESLRMQELIQQNVQLELDRDKKNDELKTVNEELMQLKLKQGTSAGGVPTVSPVHKPMSEEDLATRTKLLRLERDNRELERSLEVEQQTSQRTSAEMEKMNRKLTATIHADKKEIARLKEELRRERVQTAGVARTKSVSDETDFSQTKQVQELESKFKDAYSQSLSAKDERIQVLEKRVEETLNDNAQLRREMVALKKQNEQFKSDSPRGSPGRGYSSHEVNSWKEQAAGVLKMKEKVINLEDDKVQLSNNLTDAKHIIQKLETGGQHQSDRITMLEKLNSTLEEEKKALLTQMNKLLEKNQELLVKTLETKDEAIEDERIFNDRLGELERDKQRLQDQLAAQRRETLSREMDYWKKGTKSKNILKIGLKKLKGKIQQGKSHTFEYPEGSGGSSHNVGPIGSMASIGSSGSGNLPYHGHEGSISSSQSISSSNSKQSEEQEEETDPASALESAGGSNLIPRAATLDGSPYNRPRKEHRHSLNLPGLGTVQLRHGSSNPRTQPHQRITQGYDRDRIPDDLMSLEDFLAESEKTPNRRRVMELKRASLVLATPPVTPRNSLLLTASNSNQMFDLQEFLSKSAVEQGIIADTRSQRGTIHEVVEENDDLDQIFMQEQAAEFKASQQSMSQHSKSSSSLHSAPSISSMTRNDAQDQGVIANPSALASNFNSNNSNNNESSSRESLQPQALLSSSENSQSDVGVPGNTEIRGGRVTHSTPEAQPGSNISWETSRIRSESQTSSSSSSMNMDRHNVIQLDGSAGSSVTSSTVIRSSSFAQTKKPGGLSKKGFHQSSGNVQVGKSKAGKPPLVKKKVHKSATDLNRVGDGKRSKNKVPCGLNLSELTDLSRSGEMVAVSAATNTATGTRKVVPPRMSREELRPAQSLSSHESREVSAPLAPVGRSSNSNLKPNTSENSQDSDDLLTWEDFLSGGSPSHQSKTAPSWGAPPLSPRSDGDDSIWLEYGSV